MGMYHTISRELTVSDIYEWVLTKYWVGPIHLFRCSISSDTVDRKNSCKMSSSKMEKIQYFIFPYEVINRIWLTKLYALGSPK